MEQTPILLALSSLSLLLVAQGLRHQREIFKESEENDALALAAGPLRNLTDLFQTSEEGPKHVTLADGKQYMCCCYVKEGSAFSCRMTDVGGEKAYWWGSGCGSYVGYDWHSWYNAKKELPASVADHSNFTDIGSCMVTETDLPDVLTSTTTITTTITSTSSTSTSTTTKLGTTIVDFENGRIAGNNKYKNIDGTWNKCCCHSDVVSDVEKSTKVVCELVPVGTKGDGPEEIGCKQLRGPGHHSWNNMGSKYKDLPYYNQCAIPPPPEPLVLPREPNSDDKWEPQCQSDNDYGWPRFESQEELEASPWSSYFKNAYGELPKVYPLCVYDLEAINMAAFKKANITGHKLVPANEVKEGDLFEGGSTGYQIYHAKWEPLAANTWFEFSHMALPTELKSSWVWRQRGSGVWFNTGSTMVFPSPPNKPAHEEAIAFLKENCSITPSIGWPRQESDIFGFCAREKGIDTIQFEPETGKVPTGTFGLTGLTEIVIVKLDGMYSCGVEDASKSPLRAGWMASRQCKCKNVEISDSCGLMERPPVPLNFLGTDPPICKLQEKSLWAKCDPTSCKGTSCEGNMNAWHVD